MNNIYYLFTLLFLLNSNCYSNNIKIFGFSLGAKENDGVAFCKKVPPSLSVIKKGPNGIFLISAKFIKQKYKEGTEVLDLDLAEKKPKECWFLKSESDFPLLVSGLEFLGKPTLYDKYMGGFKTK